MTFDQRYDVVIVGGGPAGLTAAVVLGRALRTVLVVDDGTPRNAPASGVHGFLTRDGMSPADFLAFGRADVQRYGAHVRTGRVVSAAGANDAFTVTLDDGTTVTSRRLIVTSGLVDELPDLPGLSETWGRSVLHCTYCHGWEARDRAVAVLATGAAAADLAINWRHWTPNVVLVRHGAGELSPEIGVVLSRAGIATADGWASRLVTADGQLRGVELSDGSLVACDYVAVQTRPVARSAVLESLGVPLHEDDHGVRVVAGRHGLTSVPGVWAAGNVVNPSAQVITAAAAGSAVASAVHNDLLIKDFTAAAVSAAAEPAG